MKNGEIETYISPFKGVEEYLGQLRALVEDLSWFDASESRERILHAALNGEFSQTLRQNVDIKTLKQYGAFFTPDLMADQLISDISGDQYISVLDPACGAGNLLIAYAKNLPIGKTLHATLTLWESYLFGFDIACEFVLASKIRLILLAVQRGKFTQELEKRPEEYFPNIKIADSLLVEWPFVDLIIMNPPYTRVEAPKYYPLSTSFVTQAALFLYKACQMPKGTQIKAILPDVIRSGRNFKRLRHFVGEHAHIEPPRILGQFDSKTGVDVFVLDALVSQRALLDAPSDDWMPKNLINNEFLSLDDVFKISVGAVVPHRHKALVEAPEVRYMDVRHAVPWGEVDSDTLDSFLRFSGTTVEPPFVLVRRTSNPSDKYRAVATYVSGNQRVAIENHLLVLQPKRKNKAEDCKKLTDILRDTKTSDWLNISIRCRHLTTGALGDVPWWEE